MDQVKKISELNVIMNKLRGRLFTNVEASSMAPEKEAAFKRSVRDVTSICWEQLKELLIRGDNE
jgi:hypothetical protein